jgi:hypothetical protein
MTDREVLILKKKTNWVFTFNQDNFSAKNAFFTPSSFWLSNAAISLRREDAR